MSVAGVKKPAPSAQSAEEASSKKPNLGIPRWAKISLVALTVIAVAAASYYFYSTQLAEETAKKFFEPTGSSSGSNPTNNFSLSPSERDPSLFQGKLQEAYEWNVGRLVADIGGILAGCGLLLYGRWEHANRLR